MKRLLESFVFSLAISVAMAQPVQIVVPNGLANVEGNASMSDFLNSSSFRMQMVFDASQFAALPNSPNLTNSFNSIGFRLDGGSTQDVVYFFGGASVTLSTTTRTPGNLSPVFADNVGPDAVTILDQAVGFGSTYQPGTAPQPFDTMIIATAPFFYSPSRGNLLVDITAAAGLVQLSGAFDAQNATGDSVSRVFAVNGNSLSGTPDTLGLVTRFDFTVVPEPTTLLLTATALSLIFLFKRR